MSKRISALLLTVIMVFGLSLPVYAEDGTVSYVGGAEKYIFSPGSEQSPTDLFNSFKNVMPGDSLTQKIVVRNDGRNKTKIRVYLRSLGGQDGIGFLNGMKLTVSNADGSPLYEAVADQTAQLSDWFCLGTVNYGGEVTLNVCLDVPVTFGNEFENVSGSIDWEFKVEELSDPENGDTKTKGGTVTRKDISGTASDTEILGIRSGHFVVYAAAVVLDAVMLILLMIFLRRRGKRAVSDG